MYELKIRAEALINTQRYMREKGLRIIRARPYRQDREDYYHLLYIVE